MGAAGGVNVTTSDAGIGWNAGMIGQFDLGGHWLVQGQLGCLIERNIDSWDDYDLAGEPSTASHSVQSRRSWLEFSSMAAFHPQLRNKVGVLVGIGFSTRLLMRASTMATLDPGFHQGTNYGTVDMTKYLYRWNYGLPLQLGMDFKIGDHKVAWLLEYQVPLRNLYKPATFNPDLAFDYSWVPADEKYHSITLRLTYMIPIKK
jgi:hypothetical protein